MVERCVWTTQLCRKMHCCKLFVCVLSLILISPRVIVKPFSAQVGKYRRITRFLNTLTLPVSVCITVSESRNRTGQGWCLQWRCQGLPGPSFKSLHSSPVISLTPWPFSFHPAPSYFSCSPSSSLCEEESGSVEDLVTPLMTAAVSLSYQLHRLTDTLSNPDPSFYSPFENLYQLQQHPPQCRPPHFSPRLPPILLRALSVKHITFCLVMFGGCHWICCTLQCILTVNMWPPPGSD